MNRFLTTMSSTLIATGLAILPVASFAQTGGDAAKAPAAQTTAVQPGTDVKTPVVTQDKMQPMKTAPATTAKAGAKTDAKAPMTSKPATHAAKTPVHHHVAKAPMKDGSSKG